MARRSTCAMRSSTTAMWWKTCAPRARCSSTSSRTPAGAIVVFSAHGVSQAVRAEADARGLQVFDATCPLVTKVHIEVSRMRAAGREIIMIGHKGHPEVEGTLGQAQGGMYLVETVEDVAGLQVADPDNLAYVTQTTLSVDDAPPCRRRSRRAFPISSNQRRATSATPRRTARTRSRSWRRIAIWCWWSAARTARTPTVCAKWPSARAWPRIDRRRALDPAGMVGRPPAHRRHGRRVRAGNPGAAGDRTRQGVGRGIGPHHAGPGGKRGLPLPGAVAQGAGGTARIRAGGGAR